MTQQQVRVPRSAQPAGGRRRARGRRPSALVIVQNLPVPLDRRVWLESQALRDAGWDVTVVCPRGGDEPTLRTLEGIDIWTYPPPPPARGVGGFIREFAVCWLRTAGLTLRAWRRRPFDVIQACNPPDTYWLLALAWRLRGVRFVFDQHDLCPEVYLDRFGHKNLLYRSLVRLERATYRSAHALISTNESYRQIAVDRGGWRADHVEVVRSAPDPEKMRRVPRDPARRPGHLVAYLGIMGPQDGVDHLLLAADYLVHDLGRSDVHFVLLGFGDCMADLQATTRKLGLSEYVTFTGRADLTMIEYWLSNADVAVAPDPPSDFNSRSTMNKVLEYMAYELPVVMYDLAENRRSAGEAALVANQASPTALAAAVAELLDDPQRRAAMGQAGRRRIEERLRWDQQVPHYVAAFERALTSRAFPRGRTTGRSRAAAQ